MVTYKQNPLRSRAMTSSLGRTVQLTDLQQVAKILGMKRDNFPRAQANGMHQDVVLPPVM